MPARRELTMRQLRQMLRLARDGVSARKIGRTLGVARSTVQDNLKRAEAAGLSGDEAIMVAFEDNKNDAARVSGKPSACSAIVPSPGDPLAAPARAGSTAGGRFLRPGCCPARRG